MIDEIRVEQPLKRWDEHTTYGRPFAFFGAKRKEIKALIYRWAFFTEKRRSDNFVGVLTVVNRKGGKASSFEVEVRVNEMAAFCQAYLDEYRKVARDMGWEELS